MRPFANKQVCDVYFVYGARNVGKTTFVHYALNVLLNESEHVFLLDADIGQPFMVMPGQLSLLKITRAKDNELEFKAEVIESRFYNSNNPASDPDLYLALL